MEARYALKGSIVAQRLCEIKHCKSVLRKEGLRPAEAVDEIRLEDEKDDLTLQSLVAESHNDQLALLLPVDPSAPKIIFAGYQRVDQIGGNDLDSSPVSQSSAPPLILTASAPATTICVQRCSDQPPDSWEHVQRVGGGRIVAVLHVASQWELREFTTSRQVWRCRRRALVKGVSSVWQWSCARFVAHETNKHQVFVVDEDRGIGLLDLVRCVFSIVRAGPLPGGGFDVSAVMHDDHAVGTV